MAEIRRRQGKKATKYTAVVRLPGHPSMAKTFPRRTDAVQWSRDTEADVRRGRIHPEDERRRLTVADLVADYRAAVLSTREGGDVRHRQAQLRWWVRYLGAYRVAQLAPATVAALRDRLQRGELSPAGRPVAAATVKRYLAALAHVFSWAMRERGVASNPLPRVTRPREPAGRVVTLTSEQRARLLAACREVDGRLYALAVLALSTAARQGELLALRWGDVDLVRRVAVIEKSKNGERRSLPLAALALELIRERHKVRRLDTDLLFADVRGRATFPQAAWVAARTAAGLPGMRWHDLRHAALSELAMSGATLSELAAVAGHKTLLMVKRYQHLSEQHVGAVVSRMNERLFA
jgi:integrase